jgi:NADH:ubiquinone oxidoreductase subunit F (NADH-binding)
MSAALAATPGLPRLLAGLDLRRSVPLPEHASRHGRLELRRGELLPELAASGLTGRGGAGFPVAHKLRAVGDRRGRPVVVANAAEGEPTSGKDKLLLRHLPHLVIDGAVALARELGAPEAIIVHSTAAHHAGDALRVAIEDRHSRRYDGSCRVEAVDVPAGFVRGHEAAIVQYLNGGPALPTVIPPRPFESGVAGRPTLIQNAETPAHVALIGRYGANWFRGLGTPTEPGSALFTVSGAVGRPGVYETGIGVGLKDLVATAGGVSGTPRAFLIGGYACAWIGAADAASLTLDEASLRPHGGSLGVGTVAVLPAGACGVCETARVARFLADESAGQCGPCVHGLAAVATELEHPRPDRDRIERWLGQVSGRGACRHPDGTARFIASALNVFAEDLRTHDFAHCGRGRKRVLPTRNP